MRKENKKLQEKIRIEKAQKQEIKVLYFAQDPQVSSRILAVLQKGASKKRVPLYEKVKEKKEILIYNKNKHKTEKKVVTASIHKKIGQGISEIEKFQVICGSNGKIGTRYNTISGVRDTMQGIEVSEVQKFLRTTVGRKLTDKEFLEMYPKQCDIFKKIFVEEYENLKSK